MGEPSPETPISQSAPEERVDSWKEIAAYLNRDVTTVQRWEKGCPFTGICMTGWARSTLSGRSWMHGLVAGILQQSRSTEMRFPRPIPLHPRALRY